MVSGQRSCPETFFQFFLNTTSFVVMKIHVCKKDQNKTQNNIMKTAVEISEKETKEHHFKSIILLSKDFAPHESSVEEIDTAILRNDFGILIIKNNQDQTAQFSWQKNIVSSNTESGYFKEIMNDLGVTVHHNEDSITVINGGVKQFLTIHFMV